MVNISLHGFSILYNEIMYDIDDVKFVGVDSERFNNFLNYIRTYREICKDYVKNINISDCNLEKLSSIRILKSEVKKNYMKTVFFDDEENWKYTLMISNSGCVHSPSIKDPKVLILKLLQPILRRELVVEVDKKYTEIVPVEELFCGSQYLKIHDYTNYRTNVDGIRYGIEFEIDSEEAWEDHMFKKILNYMMKKYSLMFEYDVTIGFIEVKTEPLEYEDMVEIVRDLEKIRNLFPEHFESENAGFHIHISKIHTDSEVRARNVTEFISENINEDEYYRLFGRFPNNYSVLRTQRQTRYRFINPGSYKTVEVRGGTTKMTCDLFKVLEFARDLAYIVNSNIDIEYSSKTLLRYFREMALA